MQIWYTINGRMLQANLLSILPKGSALVSLTDVTVWDYDYILYEILEKSEQHKVGELVLVTHPFEQAPFGATPVAIIRGGQVCAQIQGVHNTQEQIAGYVHMLVGTLVM